MADDDRSPLATGIRRAGQLVAVVRTALAIKLLAPAFLVLATGFAALAILIGIIAPPNNAGASSCGPDAGTLQLDARGIPEKLIPIYERAAEKYDLGPRGPSVLAAINKIETGFGQNQGPSSAGAIGWMQFMPDTWAAYGVDANADGHKNPADPWDAIFAAARYLKAGGAPGSWQRAVFSYNHAQWYVDQVLAQAAKYGNAKATGDTADGDEAAAGATDTATGDCGAAEVTEINGVKQICGGGRFVAIPDFPGERIDRRLLPTIKFLIHEYKIVVTDGYALDGHAANGEHPIGVALDIVPGNGGSWDDIDRLAHYAEPTQNAPRPPWRWVGYNGDAHHGRDNHLHLSFQHTPAAWGIPPRCVTVLDLD